MKFRPILFALLLSSGAFAQNLKSFTVNMKPDSLCYLSIKNARPYTAGKAGEVKAALDFGLFVTNEGKPPVIEWFNLKPDNEQVPAALWGTKTKINAISFDRDQFVKCKTLADLKRMTGYITTTSLANYAVIRNSNDYYQRCFIFEREDGKRGLIYVTILGVSGLKVEVKAE